MADAGGRNLNFLKKLFVQCRRLVGYYILPLFPFIHPLTIVFRCDIVAEQFIHIVFEYSVQLILGPCPRRAL